MRITTWNINGMRAALRKGLSGFIERIQPDVLILQEIRVHPEQLPAEWAAPEGWHVAWHPAQRLGYAGVAVWSRQPFRIRCRGMDCDDPEGRLLAVDVDGVRVVCAYLPSGSSGAHRQRHKERWMKAFLPWATQFTRSRHPVVLGGDLNIAHTERDIFYAKPNEKTSGFLPHERKWFGRFLGTGWTDFVRIQSGEIQGPYSWWSNRGRARELDRGWRIDYLLGNRAAEKRFATASILRDGGLVISDHAPVTIELR
ncbi:MAG: exodeoxyribonuclease III [Planctomycetes bacterium]|nr:exodeoxyribonuclease III [Planctomycetota bacterium]